MPDVKPSEFDICKRAAAFRRLSGFSQQRLAEAIGLTRNQLANIETGRTELRFGIGWKICKALNLNPWFLATGQQPERPFHDFDPEIVLNRVIPQSASFGAVCSERLERELKFRNELATKSGHKGSSGDFSLSYETAVVRIAKAYLKQAPENQRERVFEHLAESIRAAAILKKPLPSKRLLTETSDFRNTPDSMKRELTIEWLLGEVRRLTEPVGMKAKLAAYLNVPQARVSEWLADKYKPSGETVLKILYWVQNPSERK